MKLTAAVAVAALVLGSGSVSAQTTSAQDELRRQVERRFDVLPLQNGVALHPKGSDHNVRSIELRGGTINLDGAPATGADLRAKLGPDADLILRLSYLADDERTRLLVGAVASPGAPEPAVSAGEPPSFQRPRRERRTAERVRFGGDITVERDEIVTGDAVAIGGSVHVDGEVTGNVVAVGGNVTLGSSADVGKDVTVVGGVLERNPGARIAGEVHEVGAGGDPDWRRHGRFVFPHRFPSLFPGFPGWGLLAFMSTLSRVIVLSVLASLVLLVGRGHVERVASRAAAEPLKSGLVGLLAQLLFLPVLVITIVVLVITIVGIPLLVLVPFALLALAVILLLGFTAVSYNVGRFVNAHLGWSSANPYQVAIVGIVLLMAPILLARLIGVGAWVLFPLSGVLLAIGFLVEYVAWTIGLGAVALLRLDRPASPASPVSPVSPVAPPPQAGAGV